ncbi:MAG: putative membrane protein YadS [Paraglaciecola sp.]|jgi:uncharacterized membrane protein YadS
MNFNPILYLQFVSALAIVLALAGYYLGKRKTNNPRKTAVIGIFTALFPPFAVMFIIVLALRKDLSQEQGDH